MLYSTKKLWEIIEILDRQRKPISSKEREKRNLGKNIKNLFPYYGATRQNGFIDDYLFDEELVLLWEDWVEFYNKNKHKAYLINWKTWVNNHVHVLKWKEWIILNKFLLNFLNIFDYHGYVSWATRLKLNQSSMKNIPIPLPPLPTQKLIVQKLDLAFKNIDESISIAKKNIENIEELNKSVLEWIVNENINNIKTIEEVCYKITDWVHNTPTYIEKWVPFLSVKDVTKWFIDFSNTRFISQEEHERLIKRCKPEFWDILYTKVWTTWYAKSIDINDEFSIFVSLALLKFDQNILNTKYFEYMLNSSNVYLQAQAWTRWVTNKNLVLRDIKSIKIPLPPLQKQKEIVAYLDEVFEKNRVIKEWYEKKLKDLEEMKQSVLKEAFESERFVSK